MTKLAGKSRREIAKLTLAERRKRLNSLSPVIRTSQPKIPRRITWYQRFWVDVVGLVLIFAIIFLAAVTAQKLSDVVN